MATERAPRTAPGMSLSATLVLSLFLTFNVLKVIFCGKIYI